MKFKIHYKLTLLFILITGIILSGVFVYLNQNLRDYVYRNTKKSLIKNTVFVKSFLESYPQDLSLVKQTDTLADKIGRELDVRATIITLAGLVVGDSSLSLEEVKSVENHLYRPEIQQALTSGQGQSKRFSNTVKEEMLYTAQVFGKDKPQGIVRLSVPLKEVGRVTERLKKLLLVAFMWGFVFFVVLSFLIAAFVSRPLREMSWVAGAVARGDFSQRVNIRTGDEIGDLAKTFNFMVDKIKYNIKEITTNKSWLEAVLLSMFDGVLVVDKDGKIVLINKTLTDLFVIERDPVGRKPIEVIRNIEVQNIVEKSLLLKAGVEFRELDLLLPKKINLLIHATPVVRDGGITGAVLVFHDITKLRRLENIRKDFVANVSHELRTPVTSIKGYTETLLEGALKDKNNAEEFLKIIHSETDRLVNLINDILSLSKLESDELQIRTEAVDINKVIQEVLERSKKEADTKGLKVSTDIPEHLPEALADKSRISQVIFNLVDNAIKYNVQGGQIFIAAKDIGRVVQVSVSDTGIGIPQKHLSRIFERFYRINKDKSREKGGTGLGLSIVKHIISAHKSSIKVDSTEGKGTAFTFTLEKA